MAADIDYILSHFDRVRPMGAAFMASCPSHTDKSASLKIAHGHNGNIILRCFAGCEFSEVVSAAGLKTSDFFPANDHFSREQWRKEKAKLDAAKEEKDDELILNLMYGSVLNELELNNEDWRIYFAAIKRMRLRGVYEQRRRRLQETYKVCPYWRKLE